jgi:putative transposase
MAQKAVTTARCSIRKASEAFSVSEFCPTYKAKLSSENAEIADLLVRLTHNQRNWNLVCAFCICAT